MRNEVSLVPMPVLWTTGTAHRAVSQGVAVTNSWSVPFQSLQLLCPSEAREELGLSPHHLTFTATITVETKPRPPSELVESLVEVLQRSAISLSLICQYSCSEFCMQVTS